MELFQSTQESQGARKNSALYGPSKNSSYTETSTDENGFSYKDLLEQFQDHRNFGKKQQEQSQSKSSQQTPVKETPAETMLNKLSFISRSYNAASRAVLGSGANKATDMAKLSYTEDDIETVTKHIVDNFI